MPFILLTDNDDFSPHQLTRSTPPIAPPFHFSPPLHPSFLHPSLPPRPDTLRCLLPQIHLCKLSALDFISPDVVEKTHQSRECSHFHGTQYLLVGVVAFCLFRFFWRPLTNLQLRCLPPLSTFLIPIMNARSTRRQAFRVRPRLTHAGRAFMSAHPPGKYDTP